MNTNNWGYAGVYKCEDCEMEFYVACSNPSESDFCPFCASRNLITIDED